MELQACGVTAIASQRNTRADGMCGHVMVRSELDRPRGQRECFPQGAGASTFFTGAPSTGAPQEGDVT